MGEVLEDCQVRTVRGIVIVFCYGCAGSRKPTATLDRTRPTGCANECRSPRVRYPGRTISGRQTRGGVNSLLPVIALAASWLAALAVIVLDLTGVWRRGPYIRWQGFGVLLGIGAALTSSFVELRGWPASQLHGLRMVTDPIEVTGAVILTVASLGQVRARHQRRPGLSNQLSNDDRQQPRTAADEAGR